MWEMDYDSAASYWELKDKDSVKMDATDLKEKGLAIYETYAGFASRQHVLL